MTIRPSVSCMTSMHRLLFCPEPLSCGHSGAEELWARLQLPLRRLGRDAVPGEQGATVPSARRAGGTPSCPGQDQAMCSRIKHS